MTLATTDNREQYNGDAAQVEFPYTFLVIEQGHLRVYVDDVESFAWGISGLQNPAGGLVTFDSAPPVGTGNVVFLRQVPLTQLTDYEEYDPFPAETHEAALDYAMMVAQQQEEALARTVRYDPLQVPPDPFVVSFGDAASRAGKIWAFDNTGNLVVVIDPAEDKAYRWAEESEDVVVENILGINRYSAHHWAIKAANIVNPPMTTRGDLYGQSDTGPTRVPALRSDGSPAEHGDFMTFYGVSPPQVEDIPSGLVYSAPSGQLPGLNAGDKLKVLQVNVAENGYELTSDFNSILIHAKDFVEDDESDPLVTKTAYHVSHHVNVGMRWENPSPTIEPQGWINGLVLRRHDVINYSLILSVFMDPADAGGPAEAVVFEAQAWLIYSGSTTNPTPLTAVSSGPITLVDDLNSPNPLMIFTDLIPANDPVGSPADVWCSIRIRRLNTGNVFQGNVNAIAAQTVIG